MEKQRYGIIGWPITHSLSPQMQEAAFREVGIDATYDRIPVEPNQLPEKVIEIKKAGYLGLNVTVPHKQAIIPLLDEIAPKAQDAGSVNTVLNRGGKLYGYSTDGYGLEMSIKKSFGIGVRGHTFLFWGTGGAAGAASMHFALEGANKIYLVNRTQKNAISLKSKLDQIKNGVQAFVLSPNNFEYLYPKFRTVDVIIQSTSLGLIKEDPISIPHQLLQPFLRIVDMIYAKTLLLKEAEKLGCHAIDGRDMLLYQGAKSFSIWTGKEAPIQTMDAALQKSISTRNK